jgi:hypothetical protein
MMRRIMRSRPPRKASGSRQSGKFWQNIETIGFYCFYFRLASAKPFYGEERFLGELETIMK